MSPASPTPWSEPAPMYAPLAIKQKPAKNAAHVDKPPVFRQSIAANINGKIEPTTGPAQATASGLGFGETSVREIFSG
jgi:hypothetical protein